METYSFLEEIALTSNKSIRWGSIIKYLLDDFKPKKELNGDKLTLTWGTVKFFGSYLEARSEFFPEETLVKDRHLHEIILSGEVVSDKLKEIIKGINQEIGDPTGQLELPNLSSYNWIHDDIEVSVNYVINTRITKISIRK